MNSRGFALRRRLVPHTPEPRVTVLTLLLEAAAVGVAARSVISGTYFFSLMLLLSLGVSTTFKRRSGKFRRIVFAHLITTLIMLPFVFLLSILPREGVWVFGAALSVVGFLYAATLYSAFGRRVELSLGFTTVFFIVYFITLGEARLPPAQMAVNAGFSFLAFFLFMTGLERIRLGTLSSREAIARFTDSWIDRGSANFDELLTTLGKKHTAMVSVHSFVSDASKVATLIIPYIHPGPVKSMGSGELPSLIFTKLSDCNPLIFHGASDHSLNLTSRSEAEVLSEGVSGFVRSNLSNISKYVEVGVSKVEFKKIRVTRYEFNGQKIFFVSKAGSTEDLPTPLLSVVGEGRDVIDRHNGLCDEREAFYTHDEVENLISVLINDSYFDEKRMKVERVGYAYENYTTEEVGPAGIAAVVFLGDEKFAFVSVDANNMSCGLSDRIRDAVRQIGYSEVEVTTTDNHWNSGGKKSKLGYYPAGTLFPDEIIKKVVSCVGNAETAATPCGYGRGVYTLDVTVAGEGGVKELELAASKGVWVFMTAFTVDLVFALLYILIR
jgi:predicted neutral ceramidase superfamily lipid hydrolase